MTGLQKLSNGFSNDLKVTFKGTLVSSSLPTILRSSIPWLLFVFVYGINGRIRILPRDSHCVHLRNVSAFESLFLPFAPHMVVASFHNLLLDILAAVPYLLHYLIPLLYPAYLYGTGRFEQVARFFWLLGWSMWVHYLLWFVLPTAPPWVQHRLNSTSDGGGDSGRLPVPVFDLQHPEGCAFARLDRWTGIPFFYVIFTGNPVPFASFPSGHVAWPMCVQLTLPTARERRRFAFYVPWVAWATMYSCHHYLTDILAAILLVTSLHRMTSCLSRPTTHRRYKNAIDGCLLSVIAR